MVPQGGIISRGSDAPEITVLQTPKFKAEATELIGADGIEAVADYLIERPEAGAVIAGGGVRKLRWAAKGKGKRGGALQTDLSADEKKECTESQVT